MASLSTCIFFSHSTTPSPPPPLRNSQTLIKPLSLSLNHTLLHSSSTPLLSIRPVPISRALIRATYSNNSNAAVWTDKIMPRGTMEKDVRKRAMEAVDACRGRVTVGDVASKAGLKLGEAQKALQALAADTAGFLEVSDAGDVLYVFEKDYRSKLAGKSFRLKIEPFVEKAKSAGEYLVRVSFGTTLFASTVIVFTAIIFILFALLASRDSDEKDSEKRPSISFELPSDLFRAVFNSVRRGGSVSSDSHSWGMFWYWDPNYYRRRQMQVKSDEMNFLESVFSFVFGDGDPNQGLEEKRWKLIGQYIATNGGVVAADELAPYLDLETTKELGDDSYILPVLLRFDGQPEVNEEGNILYRFPSLQRTASPQTRSQKEYVGKQRTRGKKEYVGKQRTRGKKEYVGKQRTHGKKEYVGEKLTRDQEEYIGAVFVRGVQDFLKENTLVFSKASSSQRAIAVGLGGLNLSGVIILGVMLKDSAVNQVVNQSGFLKFVSNIFPLLQIYAASFFVIPLARWLFVNKRNKEIEKRNLARERSYRALELPNPSLLRKLLSARDMAQKISIGQNRIVYSTENGKFEKEYETQEWDKRFRETELS